MSKRSASDEETLHRLGYAQELRRRMSGFSNFAVSFAIISILSGCLTLFYFGMDEGGPAIIVWGWPIVGIFTLLVGLSMAEVCSSFPTAGGLYYWSAKLARSNGPAGPGPPAGSTSSARSRSRPVSTSAPRSSSTSCWTSGSASITHPGTRS